MPRAEDGGYFSYCDPGTTEVYSLDFGNQIPAGDSLVTVGGNAPSALLVADSGVDPNAQACVLAPPFVPLVGGLPGTIISVQMGGQSPGMLGGVTYRLTIKAQTVGGLILTNYAFVQCRTPL